MIKKILVPTDFSDNAQLALDYAIHLANELEADLHILHSYSVPGMTGHFISIDKYVADERREEMSDYMAQVRPKLKEKVALKGNLYEGSAVAAICEESERLGIDLIVMGTQGASGMKKAFLGSTTSNVLRRSKIPVLAIPYTVKHFGIHTLTIALDDKLIPEPFVLHTALSIGRHFNGEFNLLHLTASEQDAGIDIAVRKLFKQFDIPYNYITVNTKDLEDDMLDLAKKYKSSMLCLVKREKNWLDRTFFGSVSEELVMQSDIPILVMHCAN